MEAPFKQKLSFVTSKGNQVWLSSLALAWQQFEKQSKFTLQMPENAHRANALIQAFRSSKIKPSEIQASIYFKGGAKVEAATALNKQLQELFPQFKIQKVGKRIRMDQSIIYGALYKRIELAHPFYSIPGKIMHFCRSKVPCFEPMEVNQRNQVFVVNYTNEDNFMVRIDLLNKRDQMFILMMKNKVTLDQVFQLVRKSDDQVQPMTNNDVFKIPQLKIKGSHIITDLTSVKLRFPNDEKKYEIAEVSEHIDLQMKGQPQKDNIEELTLTVPDFENPKLKQRRMCLKDPFWIVFRYNTSHPYFAMYVTKANDCS